MEEPLGWRVYFPGKKYFDLLDEKPFISDVIDLGYRVLTNSGAFEDPVSFVDSTKSIEIHYVTIQTELESVGLDAALKNDPEITIGALSLAAYKIVREIAEERYGEFVDTKVNVRIVGTKRRTKMSNIKANMIGKFIQVRGTVIRISSIQPLVLCMPHTCNSCKSIIDAWSIDGKLSIPTSCSTKGCRAKKFIPEPSKATTVDIQYVKLQEEMGVDAAGRVPRSLECEFTEDLVDKCVPGDVITINGIVKCSDQGKMVPGKTMYTVYMDVNSVRSSKQANGGKMELQLDERDYPMIKHVASTEDPFKLVVNSLCPGIFGNELVKAGLILSLFGGCQKYAEDKNKIAVRGDIHVLVVGDPGLGKSQMLLAANQIAPRGVYVCGSYASSAGLTVTLSREKGSGDYAIEAGALVLADQGVCCIDEFDKMRKDHQSLLEAMEQQSVSLAKGGIVCTLPARASVIAAANPVGGHYEKSKTVSENLHISQAMLSRFDLIFILMDKPNDEYDQILSEHVMSMHTNLVKKSAVKVKTEVERGKSKQTLKGRLSVDPEQFAPNALPPGMLRKYIGYARKWCQPTLTIDAARLLQEFYLDLRKNYKTADSTPITTRQLESMIRLSQARARVELREYVTETDAEEVIELMKESLYQTFEDQYGNIDFRRSSGMSNSKQSKVFIATLKKEAKTRENDLFTRQELRDIATKIGIGVDNFQEFLDNLSYQGFLLLKPNRSYQLYR